MLSISPIPGNMTGGSGKFCTGDQWAFWSMKATASADKEIILDFKVRTGDVVPGGQKTFHLYVNAGGTSGIYKLKISFLRLEDPGDPTGSFSSTTDLDVTMTAARELNNFTVSLPFTDNDLAAGNGFRVKILFDTVLTTVTAGDLCFLNAEIQMAEAA